MAKWASTQLLDGGLNVLKNSAVRMLLLKAYLANDSYATVAGNAICTVTMASGDYLIAGASGSDRVCTIAAKSGTASGSGTATAIAFTDGASVVYMVTDETSGQSVTLGNTVNFPSLIYTSKQPT